MGLAGEHVFLPLRVLRHRLVVADDIVLDARTAIDVPAGLAGSTGMIRSVMASVFLSLNCVGMMMMMMMTTVINRMRPRVESRREGNGFERDSSR